MLAHENLINFQNLTNTILDILVELFATFIDSIQYT